MAQTASQGANQSEVSGQWIFGRGPCKQEAGGRGDFSTGAASQPIYAGATSYAEKKTRGGGHGARMVRGLPREPLTVCRTVDSVGRSSDVYTGRQPASVEGFRDLIRRFLR